MFNGVIDFIKVCLFFYLVNWICLTKFVLIVGVKFSFNCLLYCYYYYSYSYYYLIENVEIILLSKRKYEKYNMRMVQANTVA